MCTSVIIATKVQYISEGIVLKNVKKIFFNFYGRNLTKQPFYYL
jgi:hypothetical protein